MLSITFSCGVWFGAWDPLPIHLDIHGLVRIQTFDESCGCSCLSMYLAGWLGGALPLSGTLPYESMPQTYIAETCSVWFYREKGLEAPSSKASRTLHAFLMTRYQQHELFLSNFCPDAVSVMVSLCNVLLAHIPWFCFFRVSWFARSVLLCLTIQAYQLGSLMENLVFLASLDFSRSLRSIRVEHILLSRHSIVI